MARVPPFTRRVRKPWRLHFDRLRPIGAEVTGVRLWLEACSSLDWDEVRDADIMVSLPSFVDAGVCVRAYARVRACVSA